MGHQIRCMSRSSCFIWKYTNRLQLLPVAVQIKRKHKPQSVNDTRDDKIQRSIKCWPFISESVGKTRGNI